jgi:hypothetical protein
MVRSISPWDARRRCARRCLDLDRGLVNVGGSKAELFGERPVAVRPFGEHCDAWGPGVLGAQAKDLQACLAHGCAVLVAYEPIHEDQVDEVAVAVVRVL